jgi:hypothetical protein
MKLSTRLAKYDGRDDKSEIETGEIKRLEFLGHEYVYRVDKYTVLKDYYCLVVAGGPHRIRAITTCKKSQIKKRLKKLILALTHK